MVKNLPTKTGDTGSILGSGRSPATHSSILAWRIPWTEEPGGLQSRGSQRVWHNTAGITSRQRDGETMETVTEFLFLGSKITAGGD